MRDDATQNFIRESSRERRHEAENPSAGRIFLAATIVPLMIAACLLAAWALLGNWTRTRPMDRDIRLRGTIIAPGLDPLTRFPPPHLQVDPHADLATFRQKEDAELRSYGWINRTSGIVRIPIDRAMELLVQRGLPARNAGRPAAVGKSEYELSKERTSQP